MAGELEAAEAARHSAVTITTGSRAFMLWRRALVEGQLLPARVNRAGHSDLDLARDRGKESPYESPCAHCMVNLL